MRATSTATGLMWATRRVIPWQALRMERRIISLPRLMIDMETRAISPTRWSFNAPVPCTLLGLTRQPIVRCRRRTGTINVTTQSGCTWTAVSNASWLVITSNSSVTGNGAANYSALSNSSGSTRTGTLTVAGQSITITQSGIPTYTITASAGSNGTISPKGTRPSAPVEIRHSP